MKDSDVPRLKFEGAGYKPMEYEKWILSIERAMSSYIQRFQLTSQKYCLRLLIPINVICEKSVSNGSICSQKTKDFVIEQYN